jgi:hypothetical protein
MACPVPLPLLGVAEDTLDGPAERALGSVQLALMSGFLVQWLIDPDNAPSERDIAEGVLRLAAHLGDQPPPEQHPVRPADARLRSEMSPPS